MIYGYIRVSTDKQTTENQRFEILEFAKKQEIAVDKWIEETISCKKSLKKRVRSFIKTFKIRRYSYCFRIIKTWKKSFTNNEYFALLYGNRGKNLDNKR